MESVNVSSVIASIVRNIPVCSSHETIIVGHNSHPVAAKLARVWIRQVTENWRSKCCFIELSTPAICRYACAVMEAVCGYWIYVQSEADLLRADLVVLYPNRLDESIPLFHNVIGKNLSALSKESIYPIDCEYAPNYIVNYLNSLLNPQKKSVQTIRRARIRFAVGFDDPFYSRYVIHFLNSIGCKIVPLFQTYLLPDEVARTVVARRLSFGVILDERLNIRSFITERGEPVITTAGIDLQDVLIHSLLLGYHADTVIHSVIQHNLKIDGILVLLEILYQLSVSDTPVSEYVKTNKQNQMDHPATITINRLTTRLASFQRSTDS